MGGMGGYNFVCSSSSSSSAPASAGADAQWIIAIVNLWGSNQKRLDHELLEAYNPFNNSLSAPIDFVVDGGAELSIIDQSYIRSLNLTLAMHCWAFFSGSTHRFDGNWTLIEVEHPSKKFQGKIAVPVCVFPNHDLPFKNLLSLSFLASAKLCQFPGRGLQDCALTSNASCPNPTLN